MIEAEARFALTGEGRFPMPAYSEFMPSPYVRIKPYMATSSAVSTALHGLDDGVLDISEYEQAQELRPGLAKIATRILTEVRRLARGNLRDALRPIVAQNPAWPEELTAAADADVFADEPMVIASALALSRTQDDKGRVRWTLFGMSHDGPAAPFWRSFAPGDAERFMRFVGFCSGSRSIDGVRVIAGADEVPPFARTLLLAEDAPLDGIRTIVTFRAFASLPLRVQEAAIARRLTIIPSPGSLLFAEHPGYRKLAADLPRATQIPLLTLFPSVENSYAIRIPQSGKLVDPNAASSRRGRGKEATLVRNHRWERSLRGEGDSEAEGSFEDPVTVTLFATAPEKTGLYGKPMARNVQLWRSSFELVLDGPNATGIEIDRAASMIAAGGDYGYRFVFPPMRAGRRELFWHLPLVARLDPQETEARLFEDMLLGYITAEPPTDQRRLPRVELTPRLLERPGHRDAATQFLRDAGHTRFTTRHNIRKLLEFRELLGAPLSPSLARVLVEISKEARVEDWLANLPNMAENPAAGERVAALLEGLLGEDSDPGEPLALESCHTREYEEDLWRMTAFFAEGEFQLKNNADTIGPNRGKTGGILPQPDRVLTARERDLEAIGDNLHARYRELARRFGMEGRARTLDHLFKWQTDFAFSWSDAWSNNQTRTTLERNIIFVIPGRNRDEAVILADHYDTAYMEDVFEAARGGDGLRAAAGGADDNYSGTVTLLAAASALLPLSRAGKLERDMWLVHLTGEEFPADCLGSRALAQALVQHRLLLSGEDGSLVDMSHVRVMGAVVVDMIGHNSSRRRDGFQIAPGEGAAAARLAARMHRACERWNRQVSLWNQAHDRRGKGRARRMPDGRHVPPPFSHLAVSPEIRAEWEPRSVLYNTDGKIFSDVGLPVVLLMENYDISRSGYHDTNDTMKNIDLDYLSALVAIAIETVAETACVPDP